MMTVRISFELNGAPTSLSVEPRQLLGQLLRDDCELSEVRLDCETSTCGSCTVLLDDLAVKSCALLAPMVDNGRVTTSRGLPTTGTVGAVLRSLDTADTLPCGECRPAVQVVVAALLDASPRRTDEEISRALSGTVCRCTGYRSIVEAVRGHLEGGAVE